MWIYGSAEHFQLLVPLVSTYRYCGDEVDLRLAKSEAKILHQKIAAKEYSCDDIIRILTTRSKAQINATLNQYKNDFGNDVNNVSSFPSYIMQDYNSVRV